MLSRAEFLEVDLLTNGIAKVKDLSDHLRSHYDAKGKFECFLETQRLAEDESISTLNLESKTLFCTLVQPQEAQENDEKRSLTVKQHSVTASESGITFRIKNMYCSCLQGSSHKSQLPIGCESMIRNNTVTEINGQKTYQQLASAINHQASVPSVPKNYCFFDDKESLASLDLRKRDSRGSFSEIDSFSFNQCAYGRAMPTLWPPMMPWLPWPMVQPTTRVKSTLPKEVQPEAQLKKVKTEVLTPLKSEVNQKHKFVQTNFNRNNQSKPSMPEKWNKPQEQVRLNDWNIQVVSSKIANSPSNKQAKVNESLPKIKANDYVFRSPAKRPNEKPSNDLPVKNKEMKEKDLPAKNYGYQAERDQRNYRERENHAKSYGYQTERDQRNYRDRDNTANNYSYQANRDQGNYRERENTGKNYSSQTERDQRNYRESEKSDWRKEEKNPPKDKKDKYEPKGSQSDKNETKKEGSDQNKPNKEKTSDKKSKKERTPVKASSPKPLKVRDDKIDSTTKSPKKTRVEKSPVTSTADHKLSASKAQNVKTSAVGVSPKKQCDSSSFVMSNLVKQRIKNAEYEKLDLDHALKMVPVAKKILLQNKPAKFRLREIEDGIPTISKEIFGRIRLVNSDNSVAVDFVDTDQSKDIKLEDFFQLSIVKNPYPDFFNDPGQKGSIPNDNRIKEFPFKPLSTFKDDNKKESKSSRNYPDDKQKNYHKQKQSSPEGDRLNSFEYKLAKTINKLFTDHHYFNHKLYKLAIGSDKGIDVELLATVPAVRYLTSDKKIIWGALKSFHRRYSCDYDLLSSMRVRKKD